MLIIVILNSLSDHVTIQSNDIGSHDGSLCLLRVLLIFLKNFIMPCNFLWEAGEKAGSKH